MRNFVEAVINRRTNYNLDKNITVSADQIISTVEQLTKEVPSSFNMQSSRVVVAFNEHHSKIWEITESTLKKIVPADKFAPTKAKIDSFSAGYGTILFFEESKTVQSMQEKFATYAENFPTWASQSNGMLQFAIWTALADLGLGVNLQHYNPLIDEEVKKYFQLPDSWNLVAQMIFGNPVAPPQPIEKLPINERVKVCK